MINFKNETPLSMCQAARMQPPGRMGQPVNPSTVFRWIQSGVKGPNGQNIKLEGYRMGSRWLTTVEALERFAERLTDVYNAEPMPLPRTPASRKRACDRAERELEAMGI